jgi:hypothetical protein
MPALEVKKQPQSRRHPTHRSLARSIPTHLVPGQKTTQLININETLARQGVDNDAKERRWIEQRTAPRLGCKFGDEDKVLWS